MRHLCEHTLLTHLTTLMKYTCGLSIGINVLPDFWHIIWACGLSTSAAYSRDFTVVLTVCHASCSRIWVSIRRRCCNSTKKHAEISHAVWQAKMYYHHTQANKQVQHILGQIQSFFIVPTKYHNIIRVSTLQTEQKSLTFPEEIADSMSNKCTFINPNSPWTLHMKMNYGTNKV